MYEPERWVDMSDLVLKGVSLVYRVSSYGRVYNKLTQQYVAQVLTGKPQYFYVNLQAHGIRKLKRVHNVMGYSFLGAPKGKLSIDHIDRNKYNNALYNLRWATNKQQSHNRSVCDNYTIDNDRFVDKWEDYTRANPQFKNDQLKRAFIYDYTINRKESFEDALIYYDYHLKYGIEWSYQVTVSSGNVYYLCQLCEDFSLDFEETKHTLTKNKELTFEDVVHGYKYHSVPNRSNQGIEYEGVWYPTIKMLREEKGNCGKNAFRQRLKSGMTLHDALTYEDTTTIVYQCRKHNVSIQRITTLMQNRGMTLEEALQTKPERIIKHQINGVIKRNSQWAKSFNIQPRIFNSYNHKHGFRQALEHYGVDTTDMIIYPCDGEIPMLDNPQ